MKSGTKDSQQQQSSIFVMIPQCLGLATPSLTFHSLRVELEVSTVTWGNSYHISYHIFIFTKHAKKTYKQTC